MEVFGNIGDEPNVNLADSESFKNKIKIKGSTPADVNTKDVKIAVPLKYLSNFWKTVEMSLINCEINLILTWSSTYFIINSTGAGTFTITDTRLYAPVVTLSTQSNAELIDQLKSVLKRTINWNKHQSKVLIKRQKQYFIIDPSFQRVDRLFVLPF